MSQSRTVENVTIIEPTQPLHGDILQQQVQAALSNSKNPIAINLAQISYIDSAGLGMLVGLHKQCETQKAVLALYGLQAYVQRLVEVIRLNKVLRIFEDEASTLEALTAVVNKPPSAS